MNIFLPYRGEYEGTEATIAVARAFTNCPIVIANDNPRQGELRWNSFSWTHAQMDRLYPKIIGKNGPFLSVYRWFMTLEALRMGHIRLPVFVIDWDMLLFSDLNRAYEPYLKYDYVVSLADGTNPSDSSAAYGINRIEPLEEFCRIVMELVEQDSHEVPPLQDMAAWRLVTNTGKWNVGNLHRVKNGGLFDHNMACVIPGLQADETGYKKLEWVGGRPYFTDTAGNHIHAHVVHCWGNYKGRETALAAKAGILC